MTKIHTGSDATLAAMASIPPRIWEQDKETWKAWLTVSEASWTVKQRQKKIIADFYYLLEIPISQVTQQNLDDYAEMLSETRTPSAVKYIMSPIRRYWRFAQSMQGETEEYHEPTVLEVLEGEE